MVVIPRNISFPSSVMLQDGLTETVIQRCSALQRKIEVTFQPEGKRVTVPSGTGLLEASKAAGLGVSSICGGKGVCGKCRVIVWKGRQSLEPLTKQEERHLTSEEIEAGYRLACQVHPQADLVVEVPMGSRTGRQRLQTEGMEVRIEPKPLVKKYFVELTKPTIEAIESDEDLLLEALRARYGLSDLELNLEALMKLPKAIRESWTVTATVWDGKKVIAVENGDSVERCYGLALDVGTTKMAGFLVNLETGEVLSVSSLMNPQIPFGEDIITRITYLKDNPSGLVELQRAVVSGVNRIIEDCCRKADVQLEDVYEVAVVGNTAMHHLFLGISPVTVALAPYAPVARRGINVDSASLGVKAHPQANIHFLPNIGGFVGADNVGLILSTRILDSNEMSMCFDVGTNTEVVLGNAEEAVTCSCASGPALEGAHIRHGMRAATGAIERVAIDPDTLEVNYKTVDNSPPIGICGSGLIDVTAELLKSGVMDASGRLKKGLDTPRIRVGSDGVEFLIALKEESANEQDIVITQRDIRELQKAKAAIHTGAAILMKKRSITEEDIDRLFLAGAFGSYMEPESARLIGMYPEISLGKVRIVGNAAGVGARIALVSEKERIRAGKILQIVDYLELATVSSFKEEYLNSLFFPYKDLKRYPSTTELLNRLGRVSWSRFQETDV
jgi:uncharacterized 2Fe-2S/4Fe-4S cluster protein (DUF4445 family)